MNYNKLIFGKNNLDRIVSIEINGDLATIFREDLPTVTMPNKYWLLANKPLGKSFVKLNGGLFYQYGMQFTDRTHYNKMRFIWKDRDTFSIYNPKESFMVKDGLTYFKGMRHQDVSVLSFDIESTSLMKDDSAHVLIISNTFRRNGVVERKLFTHDEYENEGEMIADWCDWVREINPSVILGHNIYTYDLPYLAYVAKRYDFTLDLGRDGSSVTFERNESKFRKDSTQFLHYHKPQIYGRELIDTMFLSIKYDVARNLPNYRLKDIIKHLGLEVEGRVFYDAEKIRDNYTIPEEWEKIKQYAIHDADDSLALYDLMIPPFFYMTQSVPKPFQMMVESASGAQINSMMMRSYLQEAHSLPKASEAESFEGAISLGNPGIYSNVFKVDVASLYPSIMIQYEVHDPEKDPNAYFLKLVKTFTEKRLFHKALASTDKYHDDLQGAYKIFINSCYGFLGSTGLLFNSPKNAALVTRTGREILTKCIDWCSGRGFTLVNADTDSISFCKADGGDMTDEECQSYMKEINEMYPTRISWEDDGKYRKFIVLKAKNYITYGWNKKKQCMDLKMKGSALKDSKKEKALKEFCDTVIWSMIEDRNDYKEVYLRYVREAMDVKDIYRWTTKKSITSKVLTGTRANETKIFDAIQGSEYVEGDKCHVYFQEDCSLGLAEKFIGLYNEDKLLEKLFKTTKVFDNVLPTKDYFDNFKLKRNKEKLAQI